MSALIISLLTLVLLLISAFVVLLVLMQRTSQSGGMGAALGGGAAESAFGAETSNILTKGTIYGIIAYFVVALGLYLIYQSQAGNRAEAVDASALIRAENPEEATGPQLPESAVEAEPEGESGASGGTIQPLSESEAPAPVETETSDTENVPAPTE